MLDFPLPLLAHGAGDLPLLSVSIGGLLDEAPLRIVNEAAPLGDGSPAWIRWLATGVGTLCLLAAAAVPVTALWRWLPRDNVATTPKKTENSPSGMSIAAYPVRRLSEAQEELPGSGAPTRPAHPNGTTAHAGANTDE